MISEKLLCEVLNIPPFPNHDDQFTIDDNYLILSWGGEIHDEINIYELAHKCKEWAENLDCLDYYAIRSYITRNRAKGNNVINIVGVAEIFDCDVRFTEATEPEAIFKACEYILKEY